MSIIFMGTVPKYTRIGWWGYGNEDCNIDNKKMLKLFIEMFDIHKWIIGMERGKRGYEHYQFRLQCREEGDFDRLKNFLPEAHILKASDTWEYEAKEGLYYASYDSSGSRRARFGHRRRNQRELLNYCKKQGDRQITVLYDKNGRWGKSWLVRHALERGEGYYIPPTVSTVQGLIQFLASSIKADRDNGRPPRRLIFIDIPRSWKWSQDLYTALEVIKDGFAYDTRYHAQFYDCWGATVIVMTNVKPDKKKLSADRLEILEINGGVVTMSDTDPPTPISEALSHRSRNTNRGAFSPPLGGESKKVSHDTPSDTKSVEPLMTSIVVPSLTSNSKASFEDD